ncbi:MAG: polysaccharide pyruvyl transferase family protein [Synergistes sp.]|nr:polysaccharide pyruvyl transferase family protein [Synergistes sp.]
MRIYTLNYCYGNNYGAVLVQYALTKVLGAYSPDIVSVRFEPCQSPVEVFCNRIYKALTNPKIALRYVHSLCNHFSTKAKKEALEKRNYTIADASNLEIFRKKYFTTTEKITLERDLCKITFDKDDAVVCGSDVIWGQGNESKNIGAYFLAWVPDNITKVAYAPSWGRANVMGYNTRTKKKLTACLARFQAVSVREKSGVRICAEFGRDDAKWLPDPTMLLTAKDWGCIAKIPSDTSPYVLNYIVPYNDAVDTAVCLSAFAEKVITLPDINAECVWPTPEEWLGYFQNAQFVVTNSFHGIVFCILYHKPFIYTQLIAKWKHYNDRLYSLLGRFDLMDRMITEETYRDKIKIAEIINKEIDWKKIDEELSAWRNEARGYLDKALQTKN